MLYYAEKEVVEEVFDPAIEISLEDAEGDRSEAGDRRHRTDPGRVQIVRTNRNTERKEPDPYRRSAKKNGKSFTISILKKRKIS